MIHLLLLLQNAIAQNLIQNGEFENHISKNSSCYKKNCKSSNMTLIEPWKISGSSKTFSIIGGSLPQIQGNVSLHLNAGVAYQIGQRIKTKPLQKYKATFQLSKNPCSPENPKVGYVQASGPLENSLKVVEDGIN
jgi:hypothetical protein